jgi:hypothetical protein
VTVGAKIARRAAESKPDLMSVFQEVHVIGKLA